MGMYNKYPYTDFHELNLDWFLEEFNKLNDAFDLVKADVISMQDAINEFQDWFDNLDVSDEINAKINRMIADGTFQAIVEERLNGVVHSQVDIIAPPIIEEWLGDNITSDPTTVIDASLSLHDAAAEAFKQDYM